MSSDLKKCTKCGEDKPLSAFGKHKGGLRARCNDPCRTEDRLRYNSNHRQANVAYSQDYDRKHPESKAARDLRKRHKYQITNYGHILDPIDMFRNPFRAAQALGRRSGFEVRITADLDAKNIPYEYEEITLRYLQPEEWRRHTPDLLFLNGIFVELKGEWTSDDRKKVRLVREQHPDIDYRIVFSNANQRISKQSKTTYAMICKTLNIPCASKNIPPEWINEPRNEASLAAIEVLRAGL